MSWDSKDPVWSELTRVYLFTIKKARPHITVDELAVLMFVFERTYGYKKERERISIKHFTDGVMKSNSDEYITSRVGISRNNILRSLRQLLGKGLLQVENDIAGGCNLYNVTKPEDIDWKAVVEYARQHQHSDIEKGNILEGVWTGLNS